MNDTGPNQSSVPLAPADASARAASAGVMGRLRRYFLTGLVLVGPLYITFNLTWWLINWVDELVRPLIPVAYRPETYLPIKIPGTGLIIALIALTTLGFLAANLVGRTLVEFGEAILHRVPVVRPIYKTMKQIFETLFSKTGSSFRQVALVEFPAPGMWSLVFLSQSSPDIAAQLPDTEHVSAFMPCTPNPTTGFFFYVPRRSRIELDISGREGDDAFDVGGRGAAGRQRRRPAEAARGAGGGRAHGHWTCGAIAPRAGQMRTAVMRRMPLNFLQAIASGFRKYASSSGRASRSEFWYWTLFAILVAVVSHVLDAVIFNGQVSAIATITGLGLFLPGIARSSVRGCAHRSERLLVSDFASIVGVLLVDLWACIRGTEGDNDFGPDPLGPSGIEKPGLGGA